MLYSAFYLCMHTCTHPCMHTVQSHDLQSVAGMCLIEHIFTPESHLITEPGFHWPCLRRSHTESIVTKRLQSQEWARAVMTSITGRKLDQTSGCVTSWHAETCTVVQTSRRVCMDSHTYRLALWARWQPASCSFLFSLFICLITTSAAAALQQEEKMLQNKGSGGFFIFQSNYSRGSQTHQPPADHPIKIKGWSLQQQREPFKSWLPTQLFRGFIDLSNNQWLYAIKPFTADKIAPPVYFTMIPLRPSGQILAGYSRTAHLSCDQFYLVINSSLCG